MEDMGISGVEPEGLIAMRASTVFSGIRQAQHDYPGEHAE